jgi:enamine deaminase RidA (YjgF/YER057c/UK114 family)
MADYAALNKVYSEFFQVSFPSRVCIAVKELPLQARVEISAIARIEQ